MSGALRAAQMAHFSAVSGRFPRAVLPVALPALDRRRATVKEDILGEPWWSYFYIDGVRHQESTGTNNRRQAEQIELRLKRAANARRYELV